VPRAFGVLLNAILVESSTMRRTPYLAAKSVATWTKLLSS
jgi:hypothetical protein